MKKLILLSDVILLASCIVYYARNGIIRCVIAGNHVCSNQ